MNWALLTHFGGLFYFFMKGISPPGSKNKQNQNQNAYWDRDDKETIAMQQNQKEQSREPTLRLRLRNGNYLEGSASRAPTKLISMKAKYAP